MAAGSITTPSTWLNGTILTPAWAQSVQDTVDNVYDYKSLTREVWVLPDRMVRGANWTVVEVGSAGVFGSICNTAAGAGNLSIPIPTFFTTPSGLAQTLTSVSVRMLKAGTTTTTVTVGQLQGMTQVATTPSTNGLGNATSSTAGHQTITISGLTAVPNTDGAPYVWITPANSGDVVYGVLATYNNSAIT